MAKNGSKMCPVDRMSGYKMVGICQNIDSWRIVEVNDVDSSRGSKTKDGTTIPAHKLVLCAQFPGIKNSILNSGHSKFSNWSRFPHDIVMAVVDFAYTGEIIINAENVLGLYLMAHNLGCSVYALGGINDSYDKSSSIVERINLLNGEVAALKPMTVERCDHSAVVQNQAILVFGGYSLQRGQILDSCEEFTPATNTWKKLPQMPTPRYATAAAHIPGVGEIVVGGIAKTEDDSSVVDNAEIYLTNSSPLGYAGSWCEIAPMLNKRSIPSAEFFNGKVYVTGGLANSTSSVEMLSIFTGGPP
nr:kelch protein 18 [Hymenolepis microstoma]